MMQTARMKPKGNPWQRKNQRGVSLIEFMVAITIGMIIVAALSLVLVYSMQARTEVEKQSQQLENGRYAMSLLKQDIQLAGFWGEYQPPNTTVWQTPDPCSNVKTDIGFTPADSGLLVNMPVALQGYSESDATPSCVSNRKSGTDMIVVRRLSTTALNIDADANGSIDSGFTTPNAYFMQHSDCSVSPEEDVFAFDFNQANFRLHKVRPVVSGSISSCKNGGLGGIRQYVQRIFYISTCNICSPNDGIPTLKMVELIPQSSACSGTSCGAFRTTALAEGIDNLQLEYGVDSTGIGGVPDIYDTSPLSSNWSNVTAVKVFVLSRNNTASADYTDDKTYSLNSAGTALTGTPFNDQFRRHLYTATVRASNLSGRRQE